MPLDLEDIGRERTAWVAMRGPLEGVEVLIRYNNAESQRTFRKMLMQRGVLRRGRDQARLEMADDKERDWCRAFAEHYVLDWRARDPGAIKPEGEPYSAEKMGSVLYSVSSALEFLSAQIEDESIFFGQNGHRPG